MCGVITGVEECALRARSTHDVHHAIVGVNVVIGVLVHCELHVVVRVHVPFVVVCDEAVVRRTLGLIALVCNCCFRRIHFSLNFAVWELHSLHLVDVTDDTRWEGRSRTRCLGILGFGFKVQGSRHGDVKGSEEEGGKIG